MDILWGLTQKVGISTKSRVIITYVILETVSLHEKRQYETNFRNQDFYHTELWYFLFTLFQEQSQSLLSTSRN